MATKPQIKRLKKLIDFLMNGVHRSKFDLGHWVGRANEDNFEIKIDPYKMEEDPTSKPICNTSACVVGWFPHLFPRMAQWTEKYGEWQVLSTKADISGEQVAHELFTTVTGIKNADKIIYTEHQWTGDKNYRSDNPTPQSVAKRIIQVAKSEDIEL